MLPQYSQDKLIELCKQYHVQRLSLFGSRLKGTDKPDSDIDILVEFFPNHSLGFGYFRLEDDLSELFRSKVDLNTLLHIKEACDLLLESNTSARRDQASNDPLIANGIVKLLENIGEAAKNLSAEFREEHSQIPWRDFMRTRDRLSHGYFSIDMGRVWDIIETELPAVQRFISNYFPDLGS
jgi:uncharacterized protein with HEPN domain